jgi:hypothetical protein
MVIACVELADREGIFPSDMYINRIAASLPVDPFL